MCIRDSVWPASRHAWALNEVQRFFIEETRLGIPVDFTNEGIRGVESYKATNFPTQLGLGHTWNRKLIHQVEMCIRDRWANGCTTLSGSVPNIYFSII